MSLTRPVLFLIIAVASTQAQTPAGALTANLARYYFVSPEAEIAARADLETALNLLGNFKESMNSGPRLLQALQAYEEVLKLYHRHDGYLHLRCSQDRKAAACADDEQLQSKVSAGTAFFDPEIIAISPEKLQAFFISEPKLKKYGFALDDIRHDAQHTLPGPEQALLDQFQPQIGDWQYDLYEQILSSISFGTLQTAKGPLDVIRQRNLLAASADPHVREEAFNRRWNGLASRRDLFAFTLLQTVQAQQALAKAHRYTDAPSRKYLSMYLDPAQTRGLLKEMAQHGDIAKRFEAIRAEDFQRAFNAPMQAWDISAPEPGFSPPIVAIADLPRIYHEAFAGLGTEYQSAFDALLNPANGRADVVAGGAPNRYTGGFSIGFVDTPSILFFGRYDGTFKDLSVIAHEGGHATHRSLMSANQVVPLNASGTSFLFESFAEFNELVLADYLADHAADPRLRRYYREQWMAIKGLDAFYGAQDALLEQEIYDGVEAGRIHTAGDLDKVSAAVDGQFSVFPGNTPQLHNRWIAVSLMYEDPLYDVNYVYGGLLALKYYQLYTADRERFVPQYVALLKNGFDAPPDVLLKRFLNIDLSSPSLLQDDLELLKRKMDTLQVR